MSAPEPLPAFSAQIGAGLGSRALVAALALGVLFGFALDPLGARAVPDVSPGPSTAPPTPRVSATPAPTVTPAPAPETSDGLPPIREPIDASRSGWPRLFVDLAESQDGNVVIRIELRPSGEGERDWTMTVVYVAYGTVTWELGRFVTVLRAHGIADAEVVGTGDGVEIRGSGVSGSIAAFTFNVFDLRVDSRIVSAPSSWDPMTVVEPPDTPIGQCVPLADTPYPPAADSLFIRVAKRLVPAGTAGSVQTCWPYGILGGAAIRLSGDDPAELALRIGAAFEAEDWPASYTWAGPSAMVRSRDGLAWAIVVPVAVPRSDGDAPDWEALVWFDTSLYGPGPTMPVVVP